MRDEELHEFWEQAWRSWDDLERHYRMGKLRAERNVWALCTVGTALWEIVFGAWILNEPAIPWAAVVVHLLGLFVLSVFYSLLWSAQKFLNWMRKRRSSV